MQGWTLKTAEAEGHLAIMGKSCALVQWNCLKGRMKRTEEFPRRQCGSWVSFTAEGSGFESASAGPKCYNGSGPADIKDNGNLSKEVSYVPRVSTRG
ncbi:MAG: hypothetical protein ACTS4V_01720 [Candidatus Hodgkinia cicadicola]